MNKVELTIVAKWAMDNGYATGHGSTIEDILNKVKWQIKEEQREKDARIALSTYCVDESQYPQVIAENISKDL